MGEVYRAGDTQLNRDVAIKVLPDLFALGTERLARFTREAQTLAALNHPNIAQIYGLADLPANLFMGEKRGATWLLPVTLDMLVLKAFWSPSRMRKRSGSARSDSVRAK